MDIETFKDLMQKQMKELEKNELSEGGFSKDPSVYLSVANFLIGYAVSNGYSINEFRLKYIKNLSYEIDHQKQDLMSNILAKKQDNKSLMGLNLNVTKDGTLRAKSFFINVDNKLPTIIDNIVLENDEYDGNKKLGEFLYLPDFSFITKSFIINDEPPFYLSDIQKTDNVITQVIDNLLFAATISLLNSYEKKFAEDFYTFKMYNIELESMPPSKQLKKLYTQTAQNIYNIYHLDLAEVLFDNKKIIHTVTPMTIEPYFFKAKELTEKKESLNKFLKLTNLNTITDFGKYYKKYEQNTDKISFLLSKKTSTTINKTDIEKHIQSTQALSKELYEKYFKTAEAQTDVHIKTTPKM